MNSFWFGRNAKDDRALRHPSLSSYAILRFPNKMSSFWQFYEIDSDPLIVPSISWHSSKRIRALNPFQVRDLSAVLINCVFIFIRICVTIGQIIVILGTPWNIPFLVWRLGHYLQRQRAKNLHRKESMEKECAGAGRLNDLPLEILQHIAIHSDPKTLLRWGTTSHLFHALTKDAHLWTIKFHLDWVDPNFITKKRPKLDYLVLYKIRYMSSYKTVESFLERDQRLGLIHGLLPDEFSLSLTRNFHLVMIPFKILGVATYPLYAVLFKRLRYPRIHSLACLRFFVIDLTTISSQCLTFRDIHLFGLINSLSLLLLGLDEVSRMLSLMNLGLVAIVTMGAGRMDRARGMGKWMQRALQYWTFITFPILV